MARKITDIKEIDKSNPFTVPENYFDRLNEVIMARLPEKEQPAPTQITLWAHVKPWVYMAAMFLGLFFTIQWLTKTTVNQPTDSSNPPFITQSEQVGDDYWSTVKITEEEFYLYLEEQLMEDGYYDYMYNQVNWN